MVRTVVWILVLLGAAALTWFLLADPVDEVISGYSDGYAATAPAGSFDGDVVGVYNLGGNVSEWVHDVYEVKVPAAGAVDRDPAGPAEGEYHVIRGASWMSDRVTELRLSAREAGKERRPDVGFRIVRNVE